MIFYLFLSLGIITTVIFLTKRGPVVTLPVVVFKAVSSVLFILTGLFAGYSNPAVPQKYFLLIAAGAIFGLLGDIWLDLKYVYPKDNASFLNAGFSSFLVGHIFFVSAMCSAYCFKWYHFVIGFAAGALVAFFTAVSESLLGVFYGDFKKITVIYMFFLGSAVVFSVSSMLVSGFSVSSIILCAGLVLFLASDAVLSGIYFGQGKNTKPQVVLNHSLYYAAQFAIATSIFFF